MIQVIDTEVHLMHPEAIEPNFALGTDEPVRKAIHDHSEYPAIKKIMTLEALIESMNKNNVSHCHLMGMSWRNKEWMDANNQYIEKCVRMYPDKFSGFYIPHMGNINEAAEEISSLDNEIYMGIKFLPGWQGFNINDPNIKPVLEAIRKKDFFVMIHTDHITQSINGDTPQRFLEFVKQNQNLKILAPHMAGLLCLYQGISKISQTLKNVFYITSVSATMEFVKFSALFNSDNIIFGTDFPFNHCHDQSTQIKKINELDLSEEVKHKILYKNAINIFNYSKKVKTQ